MNTKYKIGTIYYTAHNLNKNSKGAHLADQGVQASRIRELSGYYA